MSYIDRNLLEGERVIFRTRLHWLVLAGPALLSLVFLFPLAWLLTTGSWRSYAWIPAVVGLLVPLPALIRRQSSDFAVTNKRVMFKVGALSNRSVELLLNKVEAIAVEQSVWGRLLGYGDIVVTGSGGTHETFSNIQAPVAFRRAVQTVTDASSVAARPFAQT